MNIGRYGIAIGLLGGGLLAGLGGCSDMMGNGSGHAAKPVAATSPTVAPDMVRQVQSKLRDGGYYKQGNVDGVWGSGTETAVRSFQRDHNLGSSGQLDVPTLQALNVTNGAAPASPTAAPDNTAPTPPTNANPNPPTNANPNPPTNANPNPPTNANPNLPASSNPGTPR